MIDRPGWLAEIESFHRDSPGVTAKVLKAASHRGQSPYDWLVEGVAAEEAIVDLGCGDGPTAPLISGRWVGVDRSIEELEAAAVAKSGALVQGAFEHLPFRQHTVDAVVCSMSLMLAVDLDAAVIEIRRVLRPGGTLRLLLPSTKPLNYRDRYRYTRLRRVVGLASYFPPSPLLEAPAKFLRQFGFAMLSDHCSRFSFDIATELDAQLLIRSLYLPEVDTAHREEAINLARSWCGSSLGIPLRRVVATSPLSRQ